jgi:TRAP-type mannitol/chloroaromatic compound transport system substrate-binding protein
MIGRRFILKAGGALVAAGSAALLDAPNVIAQPKFQWRMSTTWTPALDMLQGSAQRLGKLVDEMSGGRLKIEVFPGGQLMPPLGCFEAVSQGTIESFMGASYYWAQKDPAVQWFCSVPFGMDPQGMAAWYLQGGGLKLWEETYAAQREARVLGSRCSLVCPVPTALEEVSVGEWGCHGHPQPPRRPRHVTPQRSEGALK